MATDTRTKALIINRLTQDKYNALSVKSDMELYDISDTHFLNNHITNCVTKLQQDINLEINSEGNLVLKTGSVVYIPFGPNNFIKLEANEDIIRTDPYNKNTILVVTPNRDRTAIAGIGVNSLFDCKSGDSKPETYSYWYDTINNKIYNSSGTSDADVRSIPIGYIDEDNVLHSLNGISFIGNTVFGLPGVEVIVPNGRNFDNTLSNKIVTLNKVLVFDNSEISRTEVYVTNSQIIAVPKNTYTYYEDKNLLINYEDNIRYLAKIAELSRTNSCIVGINKVNLPIRLVDSNELKENLENKLSYNNVSNCITKIPQDIKLEIDNTGLLIIKAGSKVYKPNGTYFIIKTDRKVRYGASFSNIMGFADENGNLSFARQSYITSGTIAPSGISDGRRFWFDTTNNVIKMYEPNVEPTSFKEVSLPIGIFSTSSTGFKSIDQIFNGFGYLGTTFFCLPGIEGLIPNGRNEDGSLNNIKFKTTTVLSETRDEAGLGIYTRFLKLSSNYLSAAVASNCYYDPINNYNYEKTELKKEIFAGILNTVDGKIVSIIPKACFQNVDYFDYNILKKEMENKVDLSSDQNITSIKTIISKANGPVIKFTDSNKSYIGDIFANISSNGNYYYILRYISDTGSTVKQFGFQSESSNGRNEVFVTAPNPANNSNRAEVATTAWVNSKISSVSGISIGTLIAFAGDTPPTGYLKCDGAAISRTTYAKLFRIIGTKYGSGNGSSTFNLPNFINRTFWGGSSSGAVLNAGLPNITGWLAPNSNISSSGSFYDDGTNNSNGYGGNVLAHRKIAFDASRSNAIYGRSTTVQPPAVQTIICIKY